jgi:exodeoxyribonuclease-1
MKTFYWYDFETFGINPKTDRISQFAGIRTDEALNILDEQMFYCKPTNDCMPSPEACAIPANCEILSVFGLIPKVSKSYQ